MVRGVVHGAQMRSGRNSPESAGWGKLGPSDEDGAKEERTYGCEVG